MSLREVVLEIADEMEGLAKDAGNNGVMSETVIGWAKQLRRAIKASESAEPQTNPREFAERALQRQEDLRAVRKQAAHEESTDTMRALVGGPFDGDMAPVPSAMPIGAHTMIGGEIYTKEMDGNLHFDEAMTKKQKEQSK